MRKAPTARAFTIAFAAVAFTASGGLVYASGYRQAFPTPVPGTAGCGLAVIGGVFGMTVVAPLVAILCGVVAGILGAVVDRMRRH